MAPQIAWTGLGNMGRGMCKNLAQKGNLTKPLIVHNRTKQRATDFVSQSEGKAKVASSLEEAVKASDIIFSCLGDDQSVRDYVNNVVQQDVKGKLFVDCSTIHPDATSEINKTLTGKGARFVACPVFGAPPMAEGGQLVCVLGGPAEDIDKIKPYTKGVMGRENIDFSGQEPSKATLLKIIGNTFIINMIEALAQGHTLAEKSGLGHENLLQFLQAMFPGPYVAYSNRMTSGDYYNRDSPLFQVDLAQKDARHALNLAESSGAKIKNVELASKHLEEVKKAKGEKGDIAGIYGAVRQESGLKYENQ